MSVCMFFLSVLFSVAQIAFKGSRRSWNLSLPEHTFPEKPLRPYVKEFPKRMLFSFHSQSPVY